MLTESLSINRKKELVRADCIYVQISTGLAEGYSRKKIPGREEDIFF